MPELSGQMLHFAYGEDLGRAEFERACPGAEWFGPARLEGHRLIFDKAGRVNVKEAHGETVWGALWLVPAGRLAALDDGAASGYERTTRRIVSPAGPRTEATIYLAKAAGQVAQPTPERLEALVEAAKENRLPAAYIAELKTMGAVAKADKDSR